ncbi:MAG: response regulator [Pleurocapsa sp. MO_192.B19]|nr:response regulator [Pleurocapsa sp. MO_192.B19]
MSNQPNKSLKILIIDDHEAVIGGTMDAIASEYPNASLQLAKNAQEATEKLNSFTYELVITDLSIPETAGERPKPEIGINLLRSMMDNYPTLNIVVQSADARALIRLRPNIYEHEGGFTVVDKGESLQQMLAKVDWSLNGVNCTPKEMRTGVELKEEWLTLLELAFNESLKDKEIAKKMSIAERTVRHYWTKIQDVLEVYPEDNKNMRIKTKNRAREVGLID